MVSGYSTDNYTDWAVEFINGKGRTAAKPWYLWLCYGAVHGPFTPAKRHLDHYQGMKVPAPLDVYPPRPGKPAYVDQMEFWEPGKDDDPIERRVRRKTPVGMKDLPGRTLEDWVRQYHQGVLAIDQGVGRLLQALKDSGQDENTLIVFTSDQGFAWGQHGFKSKVAPYDATVAAPLIIRPTVKSVGITAGKVVRDPGSGVDLPPTFFSQAGIELPRKMNGQDLSTLFTIRDSRRSSPALLEHPGKRSGCARNLPSRAK